MDNDVIVNAIKDGVNYAMYYLERLDVEENASEEAKGKVVEDIHRMKNILDELNVTIRESGRTPTPILRSIAHIAHSGGLHGLTEVEALVEIRKLSLPWWDKQQVGFISDVNTDNKPLWTEEFTPPKEPHNCEAKS